MQPAGPELQRSKPAMIASLATTARTQFLDIGGTRFAYRRFGIPGAEKRRLPAMS
jgi:hypothetical protein